MSDLVGNPYDRLSRITAQMTTTNELKLVPIPVIFFSILGTVPVPAQLGKIAEFDRQFGKSATFIFEMVKIS